MGENEFKEGPGLDRLAKQDTKFSLDLSSVDGGMVAGDQSVAAAEFLTTPRAANEDGPALTVRGEAKARAQQLCALTPATLGAARVKTAWRPGGTLLVIASEKDDHLILQTFQRDGKLNESHALGPGRPLWCDWDSSGSSLAVMQEGVGIYLWDVHGSDTPPDTPATQPLKLCPSITAASSFCMWSKRHPQLAIGTVAGKVIVFNKAEGVMQLHDKKGKHGAAVTCGDWLFDNRLGLASGNRVKISKPLVEKGAKWESHSKFKLSGMLSRVPKKFKDAGAPRMLSFSLQSPPFVAVCIGDNYMLVFGTSDSHKNEDVGLTFPEDYGPIAGFQWLEDDTVLVALSNGYITSVDFGAMVRMRKAQGLPECVKATGTTKVFNSYLTCLTYNQQSGRIGVCGDNGFKVIVRKGHELEVLCDILLDYTLTIGNHLDSMRWSPARAAPRRAAHPARGRPVTLPAPPRRRRTARRSR